MKIRDVQRCAMAPSETYPDGARFGSLTVVSTLGKDRWGARVLRCRCDCGGVTVVRGHHIKHGDIRSCGCLGGPDLSAIGRRYGTRTITAYYGHGRWEVTCDCGEVAELEICKVENTESCPRCARAAVGKRRAHDLTGVRHGHLTALERVYGHATVDQSGVEHQATWLCRCDCGAYRIVWATRFARGRIRVCEYRLCPLRAAPASL